MNSFIKTIGFRKLKNKRETDQLMKWILEHHDRETIIPARASDTAYVHIWKSFGDGFGICVVGELERENEMNMEYYFPYVEGCKEKEKMDLQIEKLSSREAYSVVSENANVGVSLIFYLQNSDDFIRGNYSEDYYFVKDEVSLAGLASKGAILLELNKDEEQIRKEEEQNQTRKQLLEAARAGDMRAIESLTLDDMDTYSDVTKRARREDILTIVDTYFMPYGIESDQYSILGTIYDVKKSENIITKEGVYLLNIKCNHLHIRVAIHEEDLIGEPKVGRRLKANIWLQGNVELMKWEEKR